MRTPPRWSLALHGFACAAALLAAACAPPDAPAGSASEDTVPLESLAPDALHWVAPLVGDAVHANEPIDVTVYTQRTDVTVVHFAVDGEEVGACDANDPDQDCFDTDHWTWAVSFDAPGAHALHASFTDAQGATAQIDRDVTVLPEDASDAPGADLSGEPEGDPNQPDPLAPDQQVSEGSGQIEQAINSARGYLDPSSPMGTASCHRAGASTCDPAAQPACQAWSVQGARVVLPAPARIDGSTSEVDRCMQDYGAAIRRYADLRYVSRASVVAWLAATGNCDPCVHWNHGLLSAARCVATARALGTRLTARECVARMDADGHDFAIQIATEYLRRTRGQHHHDPVLEAAYVHHGAHPQAGDVNNWCAGSGASSGAFITHYVAAYNAYRTWENQAHADPRGADTHLCVGYSGWNDASIFASNPHWSDVFTRSSGLVNARVCHAYPRYDTATLPRTDADRQYFDAWYNAALGAGCEISVALKADNQQYTNGNGHLCPASCPQGQMCGDSGHCENHHVPSLDAYRRAFDAWRRQYPRVHVFSTWNEPNNNHGLETMVPADTAAQFYLIARRRCRPQDGCFVTAGDFATWYQLDATTHQVSIDWMNDVRLMCHGGDPDRLCPNGGYLDRFKYALEQHATQYGFARGFRPEVFGFHPWHDTQAYALSHAHCTSSSNCATRAILEDLGGSWSSAQVWATEVGAIGVAASDLPALDPPVATPPADFGQACGAAFLLHELALSPRITRLYLFDAQSVAGDGRRPSHPDTINVLRDRLESYSPSCW